MSNIFKAILIGAYGALFIQFLRTLQMERYETLIDMKYLLRTSGTIRKIERMNVRKMKKLKLNYTKMILQYKKPERLPTDFKYILKYTKTFDLSRGYGYDPYTKGQKVFIDEKCEYRNCFFTTERSLLLDIRNFDAIVFDIENMWDIYPLFRAPHQKYIFAAIEVNDYFPICSNRFDSYYNWTWTYRLDSDIVWSHFTIHNNKNEKVGPKINMTWIEPMAPPPQEAIDKTANKKKMAAWFVSKCHSKNDRMNLSKQIDHHLNKFGFKVDIFGKCGSIICPKERMEECLEVLQENYYFYFAFERTKSVDYVSKIVLHALQNFVVPVVYGEADYSRFLPPGSYINARGVDPSATASIMMDLIINDNKKKYYDYFRWRNHYIYKTSPEISDVCEVCKLLNVQNKTTVVKNLRKWWSPKYRDVCSERILDISVGTLVKRNKRYRRKSDTL